jgi:uroporphyrinogen decarboxylase
VSNIEWAASQVQIDFGSGWEDMCYKGGPMISPSAFEKLMVPRYKRITDALRKHGCDIIYTDCDGNINALVSLWLKGGVNGMFPVEVAGGSDPLELRQKYGKEVLLFGGVNKRALAQGKDGIRKEIARIEAEVRAGGWIPHVDHRVPPDVTLEDYRYYLALKRETFGIPDPAPWEERRPDSWGQTE